MPRFARIALAVVAVLAVLGFAASRYLLGREAIPETSDYAIDMAELRSLAAMLPGERPQRLNYQQVAVADMPKGALFAGESLFEGHPMTHGAVQVVSADGFGVIDTAFDEATFRKMSSDGAFNADGYQAIERGLASARWVVITHEHLDHLGGAAHFKDPAQLAGHLVLTHEQLENEEALRAVEAPEALTSAITPLLYQTAHALAPGVVLRKAPGHTPGSQLVFVQLANGREYLFVGDVAWHSRQIDELWYRPRLVTDFFLGENRAAVMAQLRRLHDLRKQEPELRIVVAHDLDQLKALSDAGELGQHFEL